MSTLAACATSTPAPEVTNLEPIQLPGQTIGVDEVAAQAPTPDLLVLDADMKKFVSTYAGEELGKRERLRSLHRAVSGPSILGMDYDPTAEGSAIEAFHRETANCLSYANMFVALAREAGLDARYQWVEVRPQWTRMGERVAVRLHVNAVVHLNRQDRFMVDIDPLPSRDFAGTQEISDSDAQALYHNNIAMDALAREELDIAWTQAVRALQLAPQMPHLWVNLGAVYRRTHQYDAAEAAYMQALALDGMERSAMNNLLVLYQVTGDTEQVEYWKERVLKYRDSNPYYHAWLGDLAAEEGDWRSASDYYQRALGLQPEDATLLFSLGLIYEQLDELKAAQRYVEQALSKSSLVRERERYRIKLDELNRIQTAAY
ncbi:tetratricopeptide repeat protein [Halioglobus maricola]|uniref:tetratricopeptide repeat protein n=1 Tax=Halioglobus maricola TaxID=2601894 RepID=UPI001478ADB9|nr:tetratricopeptide repeat protein [Halioglobus maricola]